MSTIRPFEEKDIQHVIALNNRMFPGTSGLSIDQQNTIFSDVCFHNPWYNKDIRSLVVEENDGRISGFLGVVPRKMSFKRISIVAAVSQHLMVERSTLASVQLLRRFLSGPQELSYSDLSVDVSRKLWERVGGVTAHIHSIYWIKLLRPAVSALNYIRKNNKFRMIGSVGIPLAKLLDAGFTKNHLSPFHQMAPQTISRDVDVATLLENINDLTSGMALRPEYDINSLSWLLNTLSREKRFGDFQKILIRNQKNDVLGWVLYNLKIGGRSEVIQIGAKKNCMPTVLKHLFYHAWKHGSNELRGRIDPAYMKEFTDVSCWISIGGHWMNVHSKNSEILNAIYKGNIFLSRLEGDLWLF